MSERREVYFSGDVQGVGFRFSTRHLAEQFPVSGFIENLPDGRVHLVAEGQGAAIDRFLAAIQAEMEGHVANVESSSATATDEFNGFRIRR